MDLLVLLFTTNQRDVKNEKWVALSQFSSRQIPLPLCIDQPAYSSWQEKKWRILLTEQFVEISLQYSKTSASVLLTTDHSFQRGQQKWARARTSVVVVQHPLDQWERPYIPQFMQLSQLQTRICINPGTFVMGTTAFRRGGRWSGQASGATAISCLGCFGWAWKWKWNASARVPELVPFLLCSYLSENKSICMKPEKSGWGDGSQINPKAHTRLVFCEVQNAPTFLNVVRIVNSWERGLWFIPFMFYSQCWITVVKEIQTL